MLLQLKNIFKWVNSRAQRIFLLKDINPNAEEGKFISVVVALMTVSWQSLRAAIANPVEALRDE